MTLSSQSQFSAPVSLVSYAGPTLDKLIGCTSQSNLAVVDCDRLGNTTLTILGSNFGCQFVLL